MEISVVAVSRKTRDSNDVLCASRKLTPAVLRRFIRGFPPAATAADVGGATPLHALLQHARQVGESIYHPAGTCAMGRSLRDAPGSVVDASTAA